MRSGPLRELSTPRLHLRRLCIEDAPAFYERLGGNETVTRHMLWQPHRSVEESADSIRRALERYAAGNFYRWAIVRREDGQLIGIIDLLSFREEENTCSFAYMLGEGFWGRGYGTEALKAVFAFAFEDLGVGAIVADHFAENPASGAVMRKAGMTFLETIPGKYQKNGQLHDARAYRITEEAWRTHDD